MGQEREILGRTQFKVSLSDDSEFMMGDGRGEYGRVWRDGYGSPTQETKRICLVKENGKWKVDNVIQYVS